MARVVIAFVVLAILGMMLAAATSAAYKSGGEQQVVDNESWDPTPTGEVVSLNESNREGVLYNETEDVRVFNTSGSTSEVDQDGNWKWYPRNGSIEAIPGGTLEGNNEQATVSYGFVETSDESQNMKSLMSLIPTLIGLALPFFVLVLFARFLTG